MATLETPQEMQRIFEDCDPIYLRQLREAAGVDILALARTACLSVAQVRHLEGVGEHGVMFYSPSIKRQAYKRVLMILGADPPTAKQEEALEAAMHGLHPGQTPNTIDNIVALVEHAQPMHPTNTVLARSLSMLRSLKSSVWLIFPLLSLLLVLYVLEPFVMAWLDAAWVTTAHAPLASKTDEQLVAHESVHTDNLVVTGAVPPAVLASKAVALGKDCDHTPDSLVKLSAVEAYKAGNYVYLMSDAAATVCVVDGAKQATLLQLKPGEGRSVYGPAPWQVSAEQLYKVQIYFQGRRLILPETGAQHFSLVENALAR
jgi:hypothetical protein